MSASPIKLDKSDASIVLTCDEHPWWNALAIGKENAWASAERHERAAHPELSHFADARRKREEYARHADATRAMPRKPHAAV